MKYNDNGTVKELKVKAFDTLPVGAEVDYDGTTVPDGWMEVEDYSTTEEVDTGKLWINDKKIYRKIFETGTMTTSPNSIDISSLNIDEVISINGCYTTGTGNNEDKILLSTWFSASYNIATTIKKGTGSIDTAWNGWPTIQSGIIILEYTKTTD